MELLSENLPKVQDFPTSVGCFYEIDTNCLKALAQLAKNLDENVLIQVHVHV